MNHRFTARDLAYIATGAALVAALGLIPAFTPAGLSVPITAQSMGVMLVGAILGGKRAAAALLLFLGLVAVGLPLMAGGRGGLSVLTGGSIGYLAGWVLGAAVVGAVCSAARRVTFPVALVASLVGGIALIHVLGIGGMMLRLDLPVDKAIAADLVFLPGDLVKAFLAATVAAGVHRAYPGLLGSRRSESREMTSV